MNRKRKPQADPAYYLLQSAQQLWGRPQPPTQSQHFIAQISRLDEINQSPTVFILMNYESLRYEYVSRNIVHYLSTTAEQMIQAGIEDTLRHFFHPIDVMVIANQIHVRFKDILPKCSREELLRMRYQINYRMSGKDGAWLHALQQSTMLEVDPSGKLQLELIALSFLGPTDPEADLLMQASIQRLNQDEYYEQIWSERFRAVRDSRPRLTLRERDILLLITQGLTSKEIGSRLHLSVHTVNTVRRKMLEKFGVRNSSELVQLLIKAEVLYSEPTASKP